MLRKRDECLRSRQNFVKKEANAHPVARASCHTHRGRSALDSLAGASLTGSEPESCAIVIINPLNQLSLIIE